MNRTIPAWAVTAARPEDHPAVREAYQKNTAQIKLPPQNTLRAWAKQHGWPTPWFGFDNAFIAKMLANQTNFTLALAGSGVEILIPRQAYTLPHNQLKELDELYEWPNGWNILVEALREIRRAVEAGVVVTIEDTHTTLHSWQSFYTWAHERYHMLEDGADKWIGDDR